MAVKTKKQKKKEKPKQRSKGTVDPFECRVPKNSKERRKPFSVMSIKK